MGIKFGEIDSSQILENEYRIGVLERLFEWFLQNNVNVKRPNKAEIDVIRTEVISVLQQKYPNSGIKLKGGTQNA